MSHNFKIVDVTTKDELSNYYDAIAELFLESFEKPLSKSLWQWAYIDNPFGDPIVSMAFDGEKLIGHYAVVPMNLESENESILGFLSMTTMVGVDYRKHGLFQELAERVYEVINAFNQPAMVFGFPNENSTPGFIRRLQWVISDEYRVMQVTPLSMDFAIEKLKSVNTTGALTLNMENPDVQYWRTHKPSQEWNYINGLGVKPFDDIADIMHIGLKGRLQDLSKGQNYNIILPIQDDESLPEGVTTSFGYRFGYRTFNMTNEPNIFVQMSMSDIF
ncbi:GNAT family N-acetyltransferase [Shewanella gaetbuli]|uniref:GNAT family N-acetyltransferase n=1 Tax=Shewanella gaetbuli TaxID=220752 RepID=A0A9X1ZL13_9GAMM|nr:GNAT family N-acetyltransferase [Shewanella gaetbuli]MCL1141727.1 GNAT family N-acetyltransferase [Shewanella gaetbuli]